MAVREFNGTTDVITFALGNLPPFNAGTMWAIVKKASDSSSIKIPFAVGKQDDLAYYMYLDNGASGKFGYWNGTADVTNLTNFLFASDGWAFIALTKATGTGTMRAHRYIYATGAAFHADMGSIANSATVDTLATLGAQKALGSTVAPFPGRIYAAAMHDVELNDAATIALATDLASIAAGTLANDRGLWVLNQASTGTSVTDLTGGGADQSAISGTTVVNGDDPAVSVTASAPSPGLRRFPLGV